MSEIDGKKLEDLRVVDLKQELENRGLDKTGNKQALIERLQKVISSESSKPAIMNIVEIIENSEDVADEEDIKDIYDTENPREQAADSESPIIIIDDFDSKSKEETTEVKEDSADKASSVESRDESVVDSKDCDDDKAGSQIQDKEEQQAGQDEDKMDINEETEVVTEKSTNANVNPNVSTKDGKKADDENSSKSPESKEDADVKIIEDKSPVPSKKLCNDQNRNLWITNISQNTRATELKQALSVHGRVMGAKVVMNARHPAACCYGYVKMETVADADNCIVKLNNTELNGHIIRIEKVRPDYLNPLKNKLDGKGVAAKATSAAPAKSEGKDKDEKKTDSLNKDSKNEKTKDDKDKDKEAKDPKDKEKAKDDSKDVKKSDSSSSRRKTRSPVDRRSRDKHRSTSRSRNERSQESSKSVTRKEREREVLTFEKIRDERDRERIRERERILRDRRREDVARQREIERNQRTEAARLEREREKLRRERERLERERAELMQFERERQKLEREKLELERMELERAKIRMQEEDRRAVKRPAPAVPYRERERSYEERKRIATDRHFDEAPPPPRFDAPNRDPNSPKKFAAGSSANKDYSKPRIGNYEKRNEGGYQPKREYEDRSHPASSSLARGPPVPKYDTGSYSNRDRNNGGDIRDPRMRDTGGIPSNVSNTKYTIDSKVSRYNERERDRSPHFRPSVRDDRDRRGITDSKPDMRNPRNDRRSYPDQQKDTMRYERPSASSASAWNTQKVFSATANKQSWSKDTWRSENQTNSDRWNSASQARNSLNVSSSTFSGNNGMSIAGPSCPPPPGINTYVNERFDYKGTMGGGGGGANSGGFYWKPPTP